MGALCSAIASKLTTQVTSAGKRLAAALAGGVGGAGWAETAGASPTAATIARTGSNREDQCQRDICNAVRADLPPEYYGRRAARDRYIHATDSCRRRHARIARRDPPVSGERGIPRADMPRVAQRGTDGARRAAGRDHARRSHA